MELRSVTGIKYGVLVCALVVLLAGCDNLFGGDPDDDVDPEYAIGDVRPAGGWIFFVDVNNEYWFNFLEAWTHDETSAEPPTLDSVLHQWKISDTNTPGTSTAIGRGYENTHQAMHGFEYPTAELVRNATHGGYNDWFIPSRDELTLMYNNLYVLGLGDLRDTSYYWSSSQWDSGEEAWYRVFDTRFNTESNEPKTEFIRVRAVRGF